MTICKSWHEPIGVRGLWRPSGRFRRFWAIVREPKRKNTCKLLLISRYFPWCSLMLHMLDPYFPLFSNTARATYLTQAHMARRSSRSACSLKGRNRWWRSLLSEDCVAGAHCSHNFMATRASHIFGTGLTACKATRSHGLAPGRLVGIARSHRAKRQARRTRPSAS